jgi:ATP-dependent DNA helicase RecG
MKVGKENEILEFKKTTGELNAGIISIAAILNKHGGGELYFGVHNNGTPLGMDISDKTLRDISQALGNFLEPKIYPKIEQVFIDGKSCVHIEFVGSQAPYLAFGRPYIRVADEDRQMSAAELERFILKKNAGRDSWDSEPSNKTVHDVDKDILQNYLEQANQVGRIDFVCTNRKETLDRLSVTDGEVISNAACALLIGFPLLEVQMAVFATKNKLTFLDIRRGKGNVRELINIAANYVGEKMNWRVVFDGSPQRKEIPEVPVEAIREAITNSYCHRDYRSTQNNEVAIYSDRVEIYNPGRFPDGLKPEDFIKGKGRSIKRNPNLAQLLYYSKDIESFGTGLQRIAEACAKANVRVEFENDKLGFTVVFYRPQNHTNITGEQNDVTDNTADVTGNTADVTQNVTDNTPDVTLPTTLSDIETLILKNIAANPSIGRDELATAVAKTTRTIQRYLNSLKENNVIQRVGSSKTGYWEIILPDGKK